jgi:hypothetical protein
MKRHIRTLITRFLELFQPNHWMATKRFLNGRATLGALRAIHTGALVDTGRVYPK